MPYFHADTNIEGNCFFFHHAQACLPSPGLSAKTPYTESLCKGHHGHDGHRPWGGWALRVVVL